MEKKIKKRQKFIIFMLALVGALCIWVGSDVENSKYILILGIFLCVASIINLVFFKKIIKRNMKIFESNPGRYQKIDNKLKSISRGYNLILIWPSLMLILVLILILLSKLNLINL